MDIRKIIRIHKLVLTETTGNPRELAERLGVSERSIYNYMSFIKTELNAPLEYDTLKKTYYYTHNCEFNLEGFIF